MHLILEHRLRAALLEYLHAAYGVSLAQVVIEQPPKSELGEFATPVCFELAKVLRKPPRAIAQEIADAMPLPAGFDRAEPAGGGYLNFFAVRADAGLDIWTGTSGLAPRLDGKVIVEHTAINPNKAAHIGHLRNAVLGDTWVRLLRRRGETVEVQNLQDNTGVQVADVVAAFQHLPQPAAPDSRFDYLCWDVYAAISQHYEQHPEDLATWRPQTLHAIEAGGNAIAELADDIATKVARRHLETMARLGIEYDLLPRESEILHLHLWDCAFQHLKERGAIRIETTGKNAGCWVMDRADARSKEGEDETKVVVRSNGIVTYVGKDIAYQMWKFGLLPLEFGYAKFFTYPNGHEVWRTALTTFGDAPRFAHADWVFNVIDTRQSYLQEVVVSGLRALAADRQAERSIHFSYEMVALTPDCARELGIAGSGDEKRVDVSGRKGTGVKADDLIDRLEARSAEEVAARHPDWTIEERRAAANAIAIGALRYFLLKYTRNTLIAFDFKEALSFEGETGPYVQYAAVRAAAILHKADVAAAPEWSGAWAPLLEGDAWDLAWRAGQLDSAIEQALQAQEPAIVAKYAFALAQAFNNFYHHHPVTQEPDPGKRAFLLGLVAVVERQLRSALAVLGIAVPPAM